MPDKTKPEYFNELKRLAPSVAFSLDFTRDPNFRWDGDGPDPTEEGFAAFDVEYRATVIVGGELLMESSHLGGSYYRPGDLDLDTNGYTLQNLEEAAVDLTELHTLPFNIEEEVSIAIRYLRAQMKKRYDEQMKARP